MSNWACQPRWPGRGENGSSTWAGLSFSKSKQSPCQPDRATWLCSLVGSSEQSEDESLELPQLPGLKKAPCWPSLVSQFPRTPNPVLAIGGPPEPPIQSCYWWPGPELPSTVCFLYASLCPVPSFPGSVCHPGSQPASRAPASHPISSVHFVSCWAVSQVPQVVASSLSHAVNESTGPAASWARRARRELSHSAMFLCVTAGLIFPFCKMGAQTSGNPGANDLSPAAGSHRGDIRKKDCVCCPLLSCKFYEDRSLAGFIVACAQHTVGAP